MLELFSYKIYMAKAAGDTSSVFWTACQAPGVLGCPQTHFSRLFAGTLAWDPAWR